MPTFPIDLPRVLILGDSISMGYTPFVRSSLDGIAEVSRPTGAGGAEINCGATTDGLAHLDEWLGETAWDAIHFNFGLHDLKYVDGVGEPTSPELGGQNVSIEAYMANLDSLVQRLAETGAELIWATTTPVPEGAGIRVAGDAARYNAAAAEVMARHSVRTDDLFTFAAERLGEIQQPANVHFTEDGSKALGAQVSEAIITALREPKPANYDEALVPTYSLPDPLVCLNGAPVRDATTWRERRRPELLELFRTHMFGHSPGKPDGQSFEVVESADDALGGLAARRQVVIAPTGDPAEIAFDLVIYTPNDRPDPVPMFLGLNFGGNHTVNDDPAIRLPESWIPDWGRTPSNGNRASDQQRGTASSSWPIELILSRGYGLAVMYYGDIDPDFDDGFANGIHPFFYSEGQTRPAPDEWGSIAAWAWGLSRAMDYLETDASVDASRVAVIGHSRLGKTSLWAGAEDERFAMVISNDSGCGGAALSRRCFGETVARINSAFPHWFCGNFKHYSNREDKLPLDQHMLIALAAPRPIYVASAVDDQWADPHGEFLAASLAGPVYELLGQSGLPTDTMPGVDEPVRGAVAYHVRTGEHDLTEFDWRQYLDFADEQWDSERE